MTCAYNPFHSKNPPNVRLKALNPKRLPHDTQANTASIKQQMRTYQKAKAKNQAPKKPPKNSKHLIKTAKCQSKAKERSNRQKTQSILRLRQRSPGHNPSTWCVSNPNSSDPNSNLPYPNPKWRRLTADWFQRRLIRSSWTVQFWRVSVWRQSIQALRTYLLRLTPTGGMSNKLWRFTNRSWGSRRTTRS